MQEDVPYFLRMPLRKPERTTRFCTRQHQVLFAAQSSDPVPAGSGRPAAGQLRQLGLADRNVKTFWWRDAVVTNTTPGLCYPQNKGDIPFFLLKNLTHLLSTYCVPSGLPGMRGFPGHWTFHANTRNVPGKMGQVGQPPRGRHVTTKLSYIAYLQDITVWEGGQTM